MGSLSLDKFFGYAVLQSLPMSVIILDNDATIRYINRASKGYFGYQAHELVGQPVSELILGYPDFASIHQQHVVAKHKDGTRFELYISISSFILGEKVDAIVILAILIINAILGFIQEYNAAKEIDALKKLSSLKALAIRDGKAKEIDWVSPAFPGFAVVRT